MKRADLIEALERVAPALSNNDIIPVMTHFWFTADTVMAYNGHVAISVPCETSFEGAVPGAHLLAMLNAASAKEVTFEASENELLVKAGSSRIKLATRPVEDFQEQFDMPEVPTALLTAQTSAFIAAIKNCLRSVSADTSVPDQLGVTMIPGDDHVTLYGSNGITLSRSEVPFKEKPPFKKRVILPALFCKQLIELANPEKALTMATALDHVMFKGPGGVLLFGQLVSSEKPLNFEKVFDFYHPQKDESKLIPIAATKLRRCLERACIMGTGEAKAIKTRITVVDGVAKFHTQSKFGEVRDQMELTKGQGDVALDVDPKFVVVGCDDFESMLITDKCFVMANRNSHYLISGKGD